MCWCVGRAAGAGVPRPRRPHGDAQGVHPRRRGGASPPVKRTVRGQLRPIVALNPLPVRDIAGSTASLIRMRSLVQIQAGPQRRIGWLTRSLLGTALALQSVDPHRLPARTHAHRRQFHALAPTRSRFKSRQAHQTGPYVLRTRHRCRVCPDTYDANPPA